jgi:hypothetical protein
MKSFEEVKKHASELGKKTSDKAVEMLAVDPLKKAFDHGGYKGVAEKGAEMIGIEVDYVQKEHPDFHKNRERLNHEAGIAICNHPGTVDSIAVLGALDRKDVKFVVANIDRMRKILPDEALLEAPSNLGGLRQLMKSMEDHIKQGGLVFMYPEGEQSHGEVKEFKSGFGALVKALPPETMVYSFHIDPEEVEVMRGGKSATNEMIKKIVKNKLMSGSDKDVVHVDEAYTKAGDLVDAFKASGQSKSEYNRFLTEKYLEQFES